MNWNPAKAPMSGAQVDASIGGPLWGVNGALAGGSITKVVGSGAEGMG